MTGTESPQFSLEGPITLKNAESQQPDLGFGSRPEQLKNAQTVTNPSQIQNFGSSTANGALIINAQSSAQAAAASQFNTPSNCY